LIYLIVGVHSLLWQEFGYLFKKQLANMTDIKHPPHQYLVFALTKGFHFGAALVVPLLVLPLPWWQIVLGYLAMTCVGSLAFVALLGPSHYSDLAEFPVVANDGSIAHTWSIHNMVTTCDWSPHSPIALFISGGFNTHASHHLFPKISHAHYPEIARIVEDTAVECGVRYNRKSALGAIGSHFRFLRNMGRKPELVVTGSIDAQLPAPLP
jgi:linoleoyl-CoA desaturase